MNSPRQAIPGKPALSCLISAPSLSRTSIVLLHGVARRAEDFHALRSALASDYQTFALDFRGHGESERAAGRYRVRDYLEDVEVLLPHIAGSKRILYGHSLGAMVALAAAARWPDKIHGLILEDPPFHTMGNEIHDTAWLTLFQSMQSITAAGGSASEIQERLASVLLPGPDGTRQRLDAVRDADSLAFSAACLTRVDADVFGPLVAGQWLEGYDLSEILPRVACPVLVLQGDLKAGAALRPEDARGLLETIPQCSLVWFEACGHLIHWERPREVLAWVRRFINEWDHGQVPGTTEFVSKLPRPNSPSVSSETSQNPSQPM